MSSSGGVVQQSASSTPELSGATDRSYRKCLTAAVAALLTESGFDAADPVSLESLTELLQSFLCELGRSVHAFTELACRQTPLPADVLLALVEMGASISLGEHTFRTGRKALGTPGVSQPPKQTSILHTGDRMRHQAGGVVPENFVEFPDSHSYIRTPTHKQPVTDYESVREKAASQKRDVERALTRFIAKTGKTHSLFNTDDSNIYPLISCDRSMPDVPVLPSYIAGLLFKDQCFEEDEYLPKKKKEAAQASEPVDEDEDGENEDGGDTLTEADRQKKADVSLNDGKDDSDVIDNPYLRPVRVPRTHSIKRVL